MPTEEQEGAKVEQLSHVSPDEIEVIAGRDKENLEGSIPQMATDAEVRDALERAFDYRGDITITKKDGSVVEGYLFDRQAGATLATSFVRLIPSKDRVKVKLAFSEIVALTFSGRDTAAGKSFEAWLKRYWEKKAAGETNIRIEPEKLD